MTAPIAFTAINKAVGTDAADMPHVLGDPADALWQGTAERVNSNFAAMNTWASAQIAAMNAMRIPSAELSGAAVIVPATSWTTVWAYARTFTFVGGKLVFLNMRMSYGGTGYWGTGTAASGFSGGIYESAITAGTLVAALRPAMATYLWRPYGASYWKSPEPDITITCYQGAGCSLSTAGVLQLNCMSGYAGGAFSKPGYFHFDYVYYTGA